jgi:hypothetical protein
MAVVVVPLLLIIVIPCTPFGGGEMKVLFGNDGGISTIPFILFSIPEDEGYVNISYLIPGIRSRDRCC